MATDTPQPAPDPQASPDFTILWTRLALFIAVVGVLGSLHLSLGMEPALRACPLCLYQRTFIMAAAGILAFGMYLNGVPTAAVTVLALTPAFAGGAIAAHHCSRVMAGVMECPTGVTGLQAPYESLAVFILLVGALLGDLFHRGIYVTQGVGALLLGLVFCISCVRSAATQEPDPPGTTTICRKIEAKS